jgi:hypothetical protein
VELQFFKKARAAAIASLLILGVAAPSPLANPQDKLGAEEVIAKHLASVGETETLNSLKSRVVQGTVRVAFRAPKLANVQGQAVLASDGEKNMMGMAFDDKGYPQEKLGYDGNDVTAGFIRPGFRSNLGDFILANKTIMKQGLMGGVLSEAWPLYDLAERKAKVEYSGVKKIGERRAHELKYYPRGGTDLRISLFFDAETFNHLRTEYVKTITAQLGANPEASASQRESRYQMTEDFADFRKEAVLILPHRYTVKLELDTRGGSFVADWVFELSRFAYNQRLDPGSFNMGTD